jgi:hypothetical protein
MSISTRCCASIFLALLVLFWPMNMLLSATNYDHNPRSAVLCKDADRFIVQDGWDSVAMYRASDRSTVHRFFGGSEITEIAVSDDEKLLLLACADGCLSMWEIETGRRAWAQSSTESGLGYVYGTSFAHDGQSCIVCNERDEAVILDSQSGQRRGVVRFPPMQTNIMSAVLSPDGTSGLLLTLGEKAFTFDAGSGRVTPTGITGSWPIRYSLDGKYIAFRSNNSGTNEHLRVLDVQTKLAMRDFGQFTNIGHIKTTEDGTFLISAQVGNRFDETRAITGVQVMPHTALVREVWRFRSGKTVNERTDFSPEKMIGVSTDYRLVTQLTDLRTGDSLWSIDNSHNYRLAVVTYTSRDVIPMALERFGLGKGSGWIILAVSAGLLTATFLLFFFLRHRKWRKK